MNKDIIYSDRIRTAIANMRKSVMTLEAMDVTLEELEMLKKYGFNVIIEKDNLSAYINTSIINNCQVITLKNKAKSKAKWVELNDLHVGSIYFAEKDLRYFLDMARKEKYKYVYIAGDITAGHPKYKKQSDYLNLKTNYEQANKVVEILSQYPEFEYYAIHGDADCSFETYKEINPLYIIQSELKAKDIKFHYINDYVANLVIEGVVKRMVHLKGSKKTYTISYPMDLHIRKQFENTLDNVSINGENYKLGFIQFGHIQNNTFDLQGSTYLTSSSGFLFDTANVLGESTTYPSGKLCRATFKNGKVLNFSISIIKMPYDLRDK
ncbi:MAG: hypothetical protein RR702_06615 [Clostridia bacterium]